MEKKRKHCYIKIQTVYFAPKYSTMSLQLFFHYLEIIADTHEQRKAQLPK